MIYIYNLQFNVKVCDDEGFSFQFSTKLYMN